MKPHFLNLFFHFNLIFISLNATALNSNAMSAGDVTAVRQNDLGFAISVPNLKQGKISYYYELISKDDASNGAADSNKTFQLLLPLDFPAVWKNRTEAFYIMMTKNAYVVNKDISFFSASRLLDVNYINATLPGMKVSRNADGSYALDGTPSATSELNYYSKSDLNQNPEASSTYVAQLDSKLGIPDVLLVQHSYNFDNIMGVRTNKSSTVFSKHYAMTTNQTLVVTYSLSFVYNVPPFFLGGADRLRSEYVKAMQQVYSNINNMK